LSVLLKQVLDTVWNIFYIAWLTMVKNRSLEQFLKAVGWQEVSEC